MRYEILQRFQESNKLTKAFSVNYWKLPRVGQTTEKYRLGAVVTKYPYVELVDVL